MAKYLIVFATLSLFGIAAAAAEWYVDVNNTFGTEDGISWATAFTSIQPAVDIAFDLGGGHVWVVSGEYHTFLAMKATVGIYGGFVGTETAVEQRDWVLNPTIMDTPSQSDGFNTVVWGSSNATLDGFTIRGSRVDTNEGAAMRNEDQSPKVVNCVFVDNGPRHAVANVGSSAEFIGCSFIENTTGAVIESHSSTSFVRCLFLANADSAGGAVRAGGSDSSFVDCEFVGNRSVGNLPQNVLGGGAVFSQSSELYFEDCIFELNSSALDRGAVRSETSHDTYIACSFFGNAAGRDGGAIFLRGGPNEIIPCTFSENAASDLGGAVNDFWSGSIIVGSTSQPSHRNLQMG